MRVLERVRSSLALFIVVVMLFPVAERLRKCITCFVFFPRHGEQDKEREHSERERAAVRTRVCVPGPFPLSPPTLALSTGSC